MSKVWTGETELLLLLIPVVLGELALKVAALVSLSRAERVRGGSKLLWALGILLINLFGSLAWFLFGRDDRPA